MKKEQLFLSTIDPNAGKTAREYGLGVEIAEYCTAVNMDRLYPQTKPKADEQTADVPRRIFHGPFSELYPCAIDPLARDLTMQRFLQSAVLAEAYGARKLIFHGGFLPNVYYPCWYTEQSVPFWKNFLKRLPGNMEICVENVMESDPQWLLDIAAGVNSPRLRLCLGVGHANVCSQIPVETWLKTLAPWIDHFHIHNNDRSFDTHSPLASGSIPMKEFLQCAQLMCPQATYTLEMTDVAPEVRWLLAQELLEEEQ